MSPRAVGLALILALAAALRFAGLGWGLRHEPHVDERVYVENVVAMLRAHDLDHRFYTYPGLFFYLLAAPLAALGPPHWSGAEPYLVSRALVAGAGVLNVALVYYVASRLVGGVAGLTAAGLLAVSPVDIQTSHQVRPDILLEGFGLLSLLAFRRVGAYLADDARAGLVIGLSTAVKFTGLLVVPFYVCVRVLRPGPRLRGLALAGALSLGVPLACTPYALIHAARYRHGPREQLTMYYGAPDERAPLLENVALYLDHVARALGPAAALLAPVGALLLVRRSWRDWAPPLLHPLSVIVVMSTAAIVFPRLILPGMGVVWLLAAAPVEALATRRRLPALALAALCLAFPLRGSLRYASLTARPSPSDQALDWIEARLAAGARIVETRADAVSSGRGGGLKLGIDPRRYDVLYRAAEDNPAELALLVPYADLVILDAGAEAPWAAPLQDLQVFRYPKLPDPWLPLAAPRAGPVALRLAAPTSRPGTEAIRVAPTQLAASDRPGLLPALLDDDPATAWSTGTAARGGEWLEVRFDAPVPLAAVELGFESIGPGRTPRLRLLAPSGGGWREVAFAEGRPPLADQARLGVAQPRQFLILDGAPLTALRILEIEPLTSPWTLTDLRLSRLRDVASR